MMKKNLKTASWLVAVIIATFSIVQGCKKNGALDNSNPSIQSFLPAKTQANSAIATVVNDLESKLLQKDYSADFISWHGQPLWDKAIQLKKGEADAVFLIPVSKNSNISAFIAASIKDGTVTYELHRRKAVEANVHEASGLNINPIFIRGMLAYFNYSIYNKVDQVPDAVYYALQKEVPGNTATGTAAEKVVTFCYNVGYCTDCPGLPEVCCYTKKVCVSIWYDDSGGGIIVGGGTGGGPHGGGNPGGNPGNCTPTQSTWYSDAPAPDPCQDVSCDQAAYNLINGTSAVSIDLSETTISETQEERTKVYEWICLVNYGGWRVVSTEKGVHKKINDLDPNKQWEWVSLEHQGIDKKGVTIGGSVEVTCPSNTPTLGIYNAVMDLKLNIVYSAVCKGSPLTIEDTKRAQKLFNMRTAPISGY
jgi:hypothetical protein